MKIRVFINGKEFLAHKDESVLKLALRNNIYIPHFCYHEDLSVDANCRTCLIEVDDYNKSIKTSCTLQVFDGLRVYTNTKNVKKFRKENMELLLSEHNKYCFKCNNNLYCDVAKTIYKYGVTGEKYNREKSELNIHKMNQAALLDQNLCISCNSCAKMCDKTGISFLKLSGHDSKTRMWYKDDKEIDCIYCGQCTVHCPVGAAREQSHLEYVEKALKDPKKIVIVQSAPSIRTSIGEMFGLKYGEDVSGNLFTAYRKLGFDKVFDVNMGADITTIVEAKELLERISSKKHLPMFTSCCPAWVKFVEFYHPELIPNLTTSRSPQIHSGGAYKTWWAEKENINPKDIVVVSIMPCTSKKYEANNEKLFINFIKPVDYVLTTRELFLFLKKKKINLPNLKKSNVDSYGVYSGAAAIYGASGGVMEAALRTAYYLKTGNDLKNIEFIEVRGTSGIKKADINFNGIKIKIAVVSTMKNVRIILDELKKDPEAYHYIEVMACPGGCIGGGGQPIPTCDRIVIERSKGLYLIDKNLPMRKAHENKVVKEFLAYTDSLSLEKKNQLLYTWYSRKLRGE